MVTHPPCPGQKENCVCLMLQLHRWEKPVVRGLRKLLQINMEMERLEESARKGGFPLSTGSIVLRDDLKPSVATERAPGRSHLNRSAGCSGWYRGFDQRARFNREYRRNTVKGHARRTVELASQYADCRSGFGEVRDRFDEWIKPGRQAVERATAKIEPKDDAGVGPTDAGSPVKRFHSCLATALLPVRLHRFQRNCAAWSASLKE